MKDKGNDYMPVTQQPYGGLLAIALPGDEIDTCGEGFKIEPVLVLAGIDAELGHYPAHGIKDVEGPAFIGRAQLNGGFLGGGKDHNVFC
ncbi:MAG: hypothetical protein V1728_00230 [Candidatus Micrarchaeota archaeon]